MLKQADIYIIFTCVVVAVVRRLGYIGRSGTDGVIGLINAPKGGEMQCSGILIHIDGPALWLLRVTQALILRHELERLEFGKDYLLPWFMMEIQFPNTTSCGFDCIYIWRHDIWYPCRL